jgi:hypothetical protein
LKPSSQTDELLGSETQKVFDVASCFVLAKQAFTVHPEAAHTFVALAGERINRDR